MLGFGVYLCLFNVVLHHASEMPLVHGPPGDGVSACWPLEWALSAQFS